MSPIDTPSFQKPSTSKTGMEQLKEHFTNTLGALLIATPILAMSALDNSAHGAERTDKSPVAAAKSLKIEKKLPQIAEENEQIYEFLEGDITKNDTLASLQKKLGKKIRSISSSTIYDDFLFSVHSEMLYRQKTDKPESEPLIRASNQMESEQKAAKELNAFFLTLETEDISKMNKAIIAYYNAIGGNAWGEQELEQWKKELELDRAKLGYSYTDAMIWVMQNEKQRKREKTKMAKR
ncbi:MAG: hypothetical protein PHH16_02275 [Candidatus Gracilibacteria bacterium]|nr:hypothetical protein [Candidatus Gracilibacteria bacterium]